ncbi:MAG: hypothetical protein CO128_06440 [Ignavibacteriales bacterium CG_4_9_14_3_um_filter_30_11]|nr:MAG: hypothetical protein CO128_06440 [Ignavibacteriales bacterium CG_4_9_14_3_um_filter_30_11]
MKNLKEFLNYLKLLTKHIISFIFILLLMQNINFAQQKPLSKTDKKDGDSLFVMTKSPLGAVLRSAVLPGWGQLYNESYIKAPIVWGILGGLAAAWIYNNNRYSENKDLFVQTNNERFRTLRVFYQDQRDLVSIYIGLTYLLNLIDAYVDAQLFDFSVDENPETNQTQLSLRIKLN